jgi:hypothetical protein
MAWPYSAGPGAASSACSGLSPPTAATQTGHHPLPWQQRLPRLDRVSQPSMIAAAAPLRGSSLACINNPTVTNYCCIAELPRLT